MKEGGPQQLYLVQEQQRARRSGAGIARVFPPEHDDGALGRTSAAHDAGSAVAGGGCDGRRRRLGFQPDLQHARDHGGARRTASSSASPGWRRQSGGIRAAVGGRPGRRVQDLRGYRKTAGPQARKAKEVDAPDRSTISSRSRRTIKPAARLSLPTRAFAKARSLATPAQSSEPALDSAGTGLRGW